MINLICLIYMASIDLKKESYREDCNIAVNLLQRNPSEFVNHSYNAVSIGHIS